MCLQISSEGIRRLWSTHDHLGTIVITAMTIGQMHQPGIEPGSVPWQGTILPLDHWCSLFTSFYLIYETLTPWMLTNPKIYAIMWKRIWYNIFELVVGFRNLNLKCWNWDWNVEVEMEGIFLKKIEELPTLCLEFQDIFRCYIDSIFNVHTTSGDV